MMDLILLLKALLLGLVEGATEFLPISSTGHLIIVGDLINFLDKEKRDVFEIVIQLGSILSVCWLYHARLFKVVRTLKSDLQHSALSCNSWLGFYHSLFWASSFITRSKKYYLSPSQSRLP
jgi:undecaprenyl-diphosphatase